MLGYISTANALCTLSHVQKGLGVEGLGARTEIEPKITALVERLDAPRSNFKPHTVALRHLAIVPYPSQPFKALWLS